MVHEVGIRGEMGDGMDDKRLACNIVLGAGTKFAPTYYLLFTSAAGAKQYSTHLKGKD